MADNTGISWADATWNPTVGCTEVSTGCKNCYAKTLVNGRLKHIYPGGFHTIHQNVNVLDRPKHWKKSRLIFVNSMSDLLHDDIDYDFTREVVRTMLEEDHHVYLILTKRPENILAFAELVSQEWGLDGPWTDVPQHIWMGVSAENQETYDQRVPILQGAWPGYKFLSAEPLLGEIDILTQQFTMNIGTDGHSIEDFGLDLDWIITGGESGINARPHNPNWFYKMEHDSHFMNIPFHFKQWGAYGYDGVRRSKKANGHRLHFRDLVHGKFVNTDQTYVEQAFPEAIIEHLTGENPSND